MTRTPEEFVDDLNYNFATTFQEHITAVLVQLVTELDKRYEVKE